MCFLEANYKNIMATCYICSKPVYAVEELKALSKTFHKSCFRCSGRAKDGCLKKLALSDYMEHGNEPYCKFCHPKLFGTAAHRQGMVNSTPLDQGIQQKEEATSVPREENLFLKADKVRRASLGKEAPVPPPTASAPVSTSAPVSRPSAEKSVPNPCVFCGKTVYHVEQLKALGLVWHKRCFKCSGTNKDGCMKVLSLTEYVDNRNQPYCRNCHTKLFGPKGSNSRLGSSIAYNDDIVKGRDSEVVESSEPTDKNLASAISSLRVVAEEGTVQKKKNESKPKLLDTIEGTVFTASAGGVGPGQEGTTRRPSLKVGGNLKNEVHKEKGYIGDGDEVDEEEWD